MCTLRQTHVAAVIHPGPLTVQVSDGFLPRTVETSVTAAAASLCGQERQVKVLPASLTTWYTWVPPTTVLINRQMEQEPRQIELRFASAGPARLFK